MADREALAPPQPQALKEFNARTRAFLKRTDEKAQRRSEKLQSRNNKLAIGAPVVGGLVAGTGLVLGVAGVEVAGAESTANFAAAAGSLLGGLGGKVGFQRRANHHAERQSQLDSTHEQAKDNAAAVRGRSKSVADGFAVLAELQKQLRTLPKQP